MNRSPAPIRSAAALHSSWPRTPSPRTPCVRAPCSVTSPDARPGRESQVRVRTSDCGGQPMKVVILAVGLRTRLAEDTDGGAG